MAEDQEPKEATEADAGHVFLLMGKEYRISRSIRMQWFFQHFNSVVTEPKPHEQLLGSNEELEVLSVLPKDPHGNRIKYCLVPSTHITFIGRRYRYVFYLDVSPSLATVDIQSGRVINDEIFEKFKNCVLGLVAPFSVPGNNIILAPELFITVLAYTSILNPETPQVLLQGCLVTEHNVHPILEKVDHQLRNLEDVLAETTMHSFQQNLKVQENQASSGADTCTDPVTLMSPEAGPISLLRNALLALQLLPDNASAGAVVITDGVFALPDASAIDSLLAQLRASTVCCSFIKVGSGFHEHCSLGYVPHCDLMQFIAMATSGAYLAQAPAVQKEVRTGEGEDIPTMNMYHRALLCWGFQRDFDLSKIDSWITKGGDSFALDDVGLVGTGLRNRSLSYALSEWEQHATQSPIRKRHMEAKLHTSISSVLSVRLREGYSIQDVSIKGGKQLQVRLTIPWKQHVQIEYLALAVWPLCETNCITHVEVTVEAPYEFLLDVSYPVKQPFSSGYRTLVVKKFRQAMKSLQKTDEILVQLQSFSSNPNYYQIPDSAKNGVPLFYLPPNSSNPVLSLQHARKSTQSQESQFAVFWNPVLSLDTTIWQRWMHCHRIGLILEHDVPLPKNLHMSRSSERVNSIQCRVSLSSLNSLFRQWSSFVLLENHSYIKFIGSPNPDSPPTSFCISRVTTKGLCIVIRVAFLGGTPGYIRHEIVSDLVDQLRHLTAPIGHLAKEVKPSPGKSRKPSKSLMQRQLLQKPCAIMLLKPLEKILIRYERVPEDLFSPYPEKPHYSFYDSMTGVYAHRTNENHMKVLCQYLHHHRWVWTVQEGGLQTDSAPVVAGILSTLTQLRLEEGFHFACNNAGIITMAKEITMKDHSRDDGRNYSWFIQYVMFSPCKERSGTELPGEGEEDWALDGHKFPKLQMVTEVWVEPQFGIVSDVGSSLQYLEGLEYHEIPRAMFQSDICYVTTHLTFDHLMRMCDDHVVVAPEKPIRIRPKSPDSRRKNWTVEQLPFAFDVIQLLPRARQVEMVFSSLIETLPQSPTEQRETPNETLFKLLEENMERLNDREITLTEEDCRLFVQHIAGRQRNDVPLPFPREFVSDCSANNIATKFREEIARKELKWRCFVRAVAAVSFCDRLMLTFLPASFTHIKEMKRHGKRDVMNSSSSKNTPEKNGENAEKTGHLSTDILGERSSSPTPTIEGDETTFAFVGRTVTEKEVQNAFPKPAAGQDLNVTFSEAEGSSIQESTSFEDRAQLDEGSVDGDSFCFNIPIYCFDCPLSALTTIDNASESSERSSEDTKKREDVFQDFTQSDAQISMDPFSLNEMPRLAEGRSRGLFGKSKDLLLHCNAVHDLFYRSFMSCIFASLKSDQHVSARDVQSAVEACEENFLEIDITEFIRTLCGHYSSCVKKEENPQGFFPIRPSSILLNDHPSSICPVFSVEHPPIHPSFLPGANELHNALCGDCESIAGLHSSITAKFKSLLDRHFKAVLSCGDLYFYSPQLSDHTRKSVPSFFRDSFDTEVNQFAEDKDQDEDELSGDEHDVFDDDDDDDILVADDDPFPQYSDLESESDYADEPEEDLLSQGPLFLQLTCSLRDRNSDGAFIENVSVNTLPICLGEIIRNIEHPVGLSTSLRITLDLNCLTLPPEPDYSVLWSSRHIGPTRSGSFSSASPPLSLSPQEQKTSHFRRQDSKTTSHDIEGADGMEPLRNLPLTQRVAVTTTCEQICWLLQDEIVSELRNIGPVTTSTLEQVQIHVEHSKDHNTCISRSVPLQFVFGAEQSMELFVKEFEKMGLVKYHLNIVGCYYYLTGLQSTEVSTTLMGVSVSGNSPEDLRMEGSSDVEKVLLASDDVSAEEETRTGVDAETAEREESCALKLSPENSEGAELKAVDDRVAANTSPLGTLALSDWPGDPPVGTDSTSSPRDSSLTGAESEEEQLGHEFASLSVSVVPTPSLTKESPVEDLATPPFKEAPSPATTEGSPTRNVIILTDTSESLQDSACGDGSPFVSPAPKDHRPSSAYLPFWLFMRIFDNRVAIFFHRRESDDLTAFSATKANGLIEAVTNEIHDKSRVVNQRLLLQDLYETKLCNSLLFPESDEDIWKHEDLRMSVSPLGVHISKGDGSGNLSRYMQGKFIFQPGHFGCDSVWYTHLPVHQRLKDVSSRPGISRGLKSIRSFLDRFGVSNRKDMFVYKESSGNVFYFRLFESLCESDSSLLSSEMRVPDQEEEFESLDASSLASLVGSRTSSQWSLARERAVELDEDIIDSKSRKSPGHPSVDTVGVDTVGAGARGGATPLPVVEESIAIYVYGVDKPGAEITKELVEVLQNRINEAALEIIAGLFARNASLKLTYADVRFIQPPCQLPKATLSFVIPMLDKTYLFSVFHYLKQNLLQFLQLPRYGDPDPMHHFKPDFGGIKLSADFDGNKLEPEMFVYNRPHSSGGTGLGCIAVFLTNNLGEIIYAQPISYTMSAVDSELFEEMMEVYPLSEQTPQEDFFVRFAIWERGDIGIEQLAEQLKCAVRHALCDFLIEYFVLPASLSVVPEKYRRSSTECRHLSFVGSPISASPKPLRVGSQSEGREKIGKRCSDGTQAGSRRRAGSLGHRRTPSNGSIGTKSMPLSCSAVAASKAQFPFPCASAPVPIPRQNTGGDDVFQDEEKWSKEDAKETKDKHEVDASEERAGGPEEGTDVSASDEQQSQGLPDQEPSACSQEEQLHPSYSEKEEPERISPNEGEASADNKDPQPPDVEPSFETFTREEIMESVEKTSQPGTPQTYVEHERRKRIQEDKRKRRNEYENGERGELHPSLGVDLFYFAHQLGVPSVFFAEGKVLTRYGVDLLLVELTNLISSLCPDVVSRIYRGTSRVVKTSDPKTDEVEHSTFLRYNAGRRPLKVYVPEKESSADRTGQQFTNIPGMQSVFVLVGRNLEQWRASLGLEQELAGEESDRPRIRMGLQRFQPMEHAIVSNGGNKALDTISVATLQPVVVPRQKFIIARIVEKEITVFTYNWSADLNNRLDSQFNRLLHWTNARCRVTSCLLNQKMGLFHHSLFQDINNSKDSKEVNPFCLSANDFEVNMLIGKPGPPHANDRERQVPRQNQVSLLLLDEVLKNVIPPRPLHRAPYSQHRDPVKRHGYHFQEIRLVQIKTSSIERTLDELYSMWQLRAPYKQVSEDKIDVLKRNSRLAYSCGAPLLFLPRWRETLSSSATLYVAQEETALPRQSGKAGTSGNEKKPKTLKPTAERPGTTPPAEESWYRELRRAYVQQFIQYMQSLQFVGIQTMRTQSPRQTRRNVSRQAHGAKPQRDLKKQTRGKQGSTERHYLQKTSLGGILLMELLFQGCHFFVRLYSLECSRLPSGKLVDPQVCQLYAVDRAQCGEYIHLLSFNYDFHLRCAQYYVRGSQLMFNQEYRVNDLLSDVLRRFTDHPEFSRNHLCKGEVAVPCQPNVSCTSVFEYVVRNAAQYDLKTLRIKGVEGSSQPDYVILGSERVLAQVRVSENHPRGKLLDNKEYDITFVVALKNAFEGGVVHLEYFVLMTSRRELYPKLMVDLRCRRSSAPRRLTNLQEGTADKGSRAHACALNPDGKYPAAAWVTTTGEQQRVHKSVSTPNSLSSMNIERFIFSALTASRSDDDLLDTQRENPEGGTNGTDSTPEGMLLLEASQKAHDYLVHVLCRAQTHCTRDLLWQRLLEGVPGTESDKTELKKRRKVSEYKRQTSDLSASWVEGKNRELEHAGRELPPVNRLSFEEFKYLLSTVSSTCTSLRDQDPDLIPLLSMRGAWYLDMFQVLTAKFSENHRLFTNDQGTMHYLVVLNPCAQDMFMLLFVDENTNSTDIFTVHRSGTQAENASSREGRLSAKTTKDHMNSVVNVMCFYMWSGLLLN